MKLKQIQSVPSSENSEIFHQGMIQRMEVSFFKYGKVSDAYPEKVDAIASLEERLRRYKEDGNTEWLMDLSNFAMIEFMHPRHPQAHFRSTRADESPGRFVNSEKGFSQAPNTKKKKEEKEAAEAADFYAGRHSE